MFNIIDSEYSKDAKLIKFYNRKILKQIVRTTVISLVIYTLVSILFYGFHWWVTIVILIGQGILVLASVDKTSLIDIKWDDNNNLTFTYYNILDKIVTERFSKSDILSIQVKSRQTRVVIELNDFRVIKLDYTKQQELDVLNVRLDSNL